MATDDGISKKRHNYWHFTHNFDDDDVDRALSYYKELDGVVGAEVCDQVGESGNRHLQGFLKFNRQVYGSTLMKLRIPTHWSPMYKNEVAGLKYCGPKRGTVVWEYGEFIRGRLEDEQESTQARKKVKQNVEIEVVARLDSGETIESIRREHPVYVYRNKRLMVDHVRWLRLQGVVDNQDKVENGDCPPRQEGRVLSDVDVELKTLRQGLAEIKSEMRSLCRKDEVHWLYKKRQLEDG